MKKSLNKLFCKHTWEHSPSFYNGIERITISVCKNCLKRVNNVKSE